MSDDVADGLPSVSRAVLAYTAFRLGAFVVVLVPFVVLLIVAGAPPVAYVGAVGLASLASALVALVKGRERRERLEAALLAGRERRAAAQRDYQERIARGRQG